MTPLTLTAAEARVVAALVEKSITTPQYYPMSVNALAAACNQKNNRSPVMSLSEGDVGAALHSLEVLRLAKRDDQGSRVPKWRHRFNHELLLKEPVNAVLVTLLLRGPQTVAELRANAAPLNGPAEADGVQAALKDLADRAQPLIAEMARRPGQAASRVRHLLTPGEEPEVPYEPDLSERRSAPMASATPALEQRIVALEARVADLERQLGLPSGAQGSSDA